MLGGAVRLQGSDAQRLGAGAGLVLKSGQAVLAALLQQHRLLQQPGASPLLPIMSVCAQFQLPGVTGFMHFLGQQEDAVAASFADTVANPQALLLWLATTAEALLYADQIDGRGERSYGQQQSCSPACASWQSPQCLSPALLAPLAHCVS